MRTPGSTPSSPGSRGMQVDCRCGAPLTTLKPGEAVSRTRSAPGTEVRSVVCPGCQQPRRIFVKMEQRG